jgi:ABC-type transport system substrate-binding protein
MNRLPISARFRRVSGLALALTLIFALLLSGCAAPAAAPAEEAPAADAGAAEAEGGDSMVTVFGETLPEDALPYDQQVFRTGFDNTASATTFDFFNVVYQRYCHGDAFSNTFGDPLVELDTDFNLVPAAAESWEVSEDGRVWTFHIMPGQVWSDGTPLTAYDYEATFRLGASPEHGWDFAWFHSFLGPGGIKNWSKAIAGEVPVEELGIRAVDDLTLEIETEEPFPPLPGTMKFSWVMQKAALEEHGPFYNSDPATHVTSGPFTLRTVIAFVITIRLRISPGTFVSQQSNIPTSEQLSSLTNSFEALKK